MAGQVLAFATGILIVRGLDKVEYSHYAVVIMVVAAAAMVSDSGISAVLLSRSEVFVEPGEGGARLFRAAVSFRRRFGAFVVGFATVWAFVLLQGNDASMWTTLTLCILLATTFGPVLTLSLMQTYFRIQLDVEVLRRVLLLGSASRLVLVAVLDLVDAMTPQLLVVVNVIVSVMTYFYLRRRLPFPLRAAGSSLLDDDPAAFRYSVARALPFTAALVVTEQLLLLILTVRSSPEVLAEFAALSRFAVAFIILNALMSDIGAPLVARALRTTSHVTHRVGLVLGLYVAAATVLVTAVWVASGPLIRLLGDEYSGLEDELTVLAVGFAAANVSHAWDSINLARGWVALSWVYVPLAACWALWGFLLADVEALEGVGILFLLQAVPALLTQATRTTRGLVRLRRQADQSPSAS